MSETRAEVVSQILGALQRMDVEALLAIPEATAEEVDAAKNLHLAGLVASEGQTARSARAVLLLASSGAQSWPLAFDGLEADAIDELRGLYWDMPEGARHEFDRRFGRPEEGQS